MRILLVLLATTSLAACGEGGGTVASAGSTGTGTTTTTGTTSSSGIDFTQLKSPTVPKTYVAVGGEQVFQYKTDARVIQGQQAQTYAGGTSSIRSSSISISYDPTAATYTLAVADASTAAAASTKFQDPASLISFSAPGNPQWGTPNITGLAGFQYYQAGDGNPLSPYLISGSGYLDPGNNATPPSTAPGGTATYTSNSLFVQTPGTTTQYVTLAGYVRNVISFAPVAPTGSAVAIDTITYHLERGAFAFGINTDAGSVPTTGTATYNGAMLGTMVYNTSPAFGGGAPTYYQWIVGSAQTSVDFGKSTVGLTVTGTVSAPQIDQYTTGTANIPGGSTFSASGSATINIATNGGFSGQIATANFKDTNGAVIATVSPIAGSTITGAFYGPKAAEVGGGFRVVGGVPNQRVDIVGAFTGK